MDDNIFWRLLTEWQRKLFTLAGLLLAIFVGLYAFADMTMPDPLLIVTQMLGFAATIFALLGFYPRLKEKTKTTMNAGLLVSALSIAAILIVIIGGLISSLFGVDQSTANPILGTAALSSLIGTGVTIMLFAVASMQDETISSLVSWLLLAQPVSWAALLGLITASGGMNEFAIPAVYGFTAIAMIVVGSQINDSLHFSEQREQRRESTRRASNNLSH